LTGSRSSACPTGEDIAADLRIMPRVVQRWLNADLEGDLEGLKPRKARGNAPAIPAHTA
jgi:hypothetical protein